jgi:hypothetical protein
MAFFSLCLAHDTQANTTTSRQMTKSPRKHSIERHPNEMDNRSRLSTAQQDSNQAKKSKTNKTNLLSSIVTTVNAKHTSTTTGHGTSRNRRSSGLDLYNGSNPYPTYDLTHELFNTTAPASHHKRHNTNTSSKASHQSSSQRPHQSKYSPNKDRKSSTAIATTTTSNKKQVNKTGKQQKTHTTSTSGNASRTNGSHSMRNNNNSSSNTATATATPTSGTVAHKQKNAATKLFNQKSHKSKLKSKLSSRSSSLSGLSTSGLSTTSSRSTSSTTSDESDTSSDMDDDDDDDDSTTSSTSTTSTTTTTTTTMTTSSQRSSSVASTTSSCSLSLRTKHSSSIATNNRKPKMKIKVKKKPSPNSGQQQQPTIRSPLALNKVNVACTTTGHNAQTNPNQTETEDDPVLNLIKSEPVDIQTDVTACGLQQMKRQSSQVTFNQTIPLDTSTTSIQKDPRLDESLDYLKKKETSAKAFHYLPLKYNDIAESNKSASSYVQPQQQHTATTATTARRSHKLSSSSSSSSSATVCTVKQEANNNTNATSTSVQQVDCVPAVVGADDAESQAGQSLVSLIKKQKSLIKQENLEDKFKFETMDIDDVDGGTDRLSAGCGLIGCDNDDDPTKPSLDERIRMLDEMLDKQQKSKTLLLTTNANTGLVVSKSTSSLIASFAHNSHNNKQSTQALLSAKIFKLDEMRLNQSALMLANSMAASSSSMASSSSTSSNADNSHNDLASTKTAIFPVDMHAYAASLPHKTTPCMSYKPLMAPASTACQTTTKTIQQQQQQQQQANKSPVILPKSQIKPLMNIDASLNKPLMVTTTHVVQQQGAGNTSPNANQQQSSPLTPTSVQIAEKLGLKIKGTRDGHTVQETHVGIALVSTTPTPSLTNAADLPPCLQSEASLSACTEQPVKTTTSLTRLTNVQPTTTTTQAAGSSTTSESSTAAPTSTSTTTSTLTSSSTFTTSSTTAGSSTTSTTTQAVKDEHHATSSNKRTHEQSEETTSSPCKPCIVRDVDQQQDVKPSVVKKPRLDDETKSANVVVATTTTPKPTVDQHAKQKQKPPSTLTGSKTETPKTPVTPTTSKPVNTTIDSARKLSKPKKVETTSTATKTPKDSNNPQATIKRDESVRVKTEKTVQTATTSSTNNKCQTSDKRATLPTVAKPKPKADHTATKANQDDHAPSRIQESQTKTKQTTPHSVTTATTTTQCPVKPVNSQAKTPTTIVKPKTGSDQQMTTKSGDSHGHKVTKVQQQQQQAKVPVAKPKSQINDLYDSEESDCGRPSFVEPKKAIQTTTMTTTKTNARKQSTTSSGCSGKSSSSTSSSSSGSDSSSDGSGSSNESSNEDDKRPMATDKYRQMATKQTDRPKKQIIKKKKKKDSQVAPPPSKKKQTKKQKQVAKASNNQHDDDNDDRKDRSKPKTKANNKHYDDDDDDNDDADNPDPSLNNEENETGQSDHSSNENDNETGNKSEESNDTTMSSQGDQSVASSSCKVRSNHTANNNHHHINKVPSTTKKGITRTVTHSVDHISILLTTSLSFSLFRSQTNQIKRTQTRQTNEKADEAGKNASVKSEWQKLDTS